MKIKINNKSYTREIEIDATLLVVIAMPYDEYVQYEVFNADPEKAESLGKTVVCDDELLFQCRIRKNGSNSWLFGDEDMKGVNLTQGYGLLLLLDVMLELFYWTHELLPGFEGNIKRDDRPFHLGTIPDRKEQREVWQIT